MKISLHKMGVALVALLSINALAYAHGISDADQIRAMNGGIVEFLRQGAVHMITGYDHLLFLLGVVFFLTKFKDIVKFVTAFTLGHSITLIGATFMGIQANYFLIDAVIALTVCYKGFDNLGGFKKYLDMKSPNLLYMVFIFGLIHGFGLSTRLQHIVIGEGMDLLGKTIAFNIGVEAGQIAALAIMVAILSMVRHTKSFKRFSTATNFTLIVLGGLLLMMQLHGYSHEKDPMGFFDEKAHQHQHEDLGIVGGSFSQGSLPPGYHVDEPGGTPHTHDDTTEAGGHDHGAAGKFDTIVTRIFDMRTGYKNATTDAEVLEVHHSIMDIFAEMITLRQVIPEITYLDFNQIDAHMINAGITLRRIDGEAHEGNVEKTKELIKRFDENLLAIEDLINHPVMPEGFHVDAPGGTPHTHDTAEDGGHDHGDAYKYDVNVTRIFDTRSEYKNAKSNEELLEAHHPISEVFLELEYLRLLLAEFEYLDFKQIDAHIKEAGIAAGAIDQEAHDGNAATISDHIKRFDENVLAFEELINHPVMPEGYHIDAPGDAPHKH